MFFGHIGSGKTTELRQYLDRFTASGYYLPVEVNVLTLLDSNNLAYSEVLMATAERLLQELKGNGIEVPDASLKPIQEWFASSTRQPRDAGTCPAKPGPRSGWAAGITVPARPARNREDREIDAGPHNLTRGVLASCAIPGVFRPVPVGAETYVDGGARENLPAEMAIGHLQTGRTYII